MPHMCIDKDSATVGAQLLDVPHSTPTASSVEQKKTVSCLELHYYSKALNLPVLLESIQHGQHGQ